jgi:hypothetical protein
MIHISNRDKTHYRSYHAFIRTELQQRKRKMKKLTDNATISKENLLSTNSSDHISMTLLSRCTDLVLVFNRQLDLLEKYK